MNDFQEDPHPCVGYCQTDEAGYCLGCGRPSPAVVASRARDEDNMRFELSAGDCQPAGNRFPIDPLSQ